MNITISDEFGNTRELSVNPGVPFNTEPYYRVLECCGRRKLRGGPKRCTCNSTFNTTVGIYGKERGKKVYLDLARRPSAGNGIGLVLVDESGARISRGFVARFTEQGELHLSQGVTTLVNLALDEKGRVKIEK